MPTKDWRKVRKLSELQKANLLYGQLIRKVNCTIQLIQLLHEFGRHEEARQVENAVAIATIKIRSKSFMAVAKAKQAKNLEKQNESAKDDH